MSFESFNRCFRKKKKKKKRKEKKKKKIQPKAGGCFYLQRHLNFFFSNKRNLYKIEKERERNVCYNQKHIAKLKLKCFYENLLIEDNYLNLKATKQTKMANLNILKNK